MIKPESDVALSETASRRSVWLIVRQRLFNALPNVLILLTLGGAWLTIHRLQTHDRHDHVAEPSVSELQDADVIELAEGKRQAGQFQSSLVELKSLAHEHVVPGRLRYDQGSHIDVKSPVEGILVELRVAPGEQVDAGALLAVVYSPEVGQARSEVLRRQKELQIARQVLAREQDLVTNLDEFLALLERRAPVEKIEEQLRNKSLGNYRQGLLSAYSKLCLAEQLVENLPTLVATGAVAGRVAYERETERRVAESEYQTAREDAAYAARLALSRAEAAAEEAERQLNLAWQSLDALLGNPAPRRDTQEFAAESLLKLEVRAPFAGTIESRQFAANERVSRGDTLFVLANTTRLTVEASIRDNDWAVIGLQPEATITVIVPALNHQSFPANVRYFGRELQVENNSIPLVATIDNQHGQLRPGMFVRVKIPVSASREVVTIAPDAVMQHEGQQFVFVDLQDGKFKKVDVTVGATVGDLVEITHGLQPGQLVVTRGAFLLKSELLQRAEE